MTQPSDIQEFSAALRPLALIHRITMALSSAVGTDELAEAIGGVMVSPLGLHFSRAFLLVYDDRRECFLAERAVGVSSTEQARERIARADAERTYLDGLTHTLAARGESGLREFLDRIRAGALCVDVLQRNGAGRLHVEGWADLCIVPSRQQPHRLFTRLAAQPAVLRIDGADALADLPPPLPQILRTPFVALSVETNRGVRLAVLADRAFQPDAAVSDTDLSLLEWLRSALALAWSSAELYAEQEHALERQRRLEELKDSFLATISHELRTPLTAILGFLDVVTGTHAGPLTAEQRALLDRTRQQADHLLGLVNDLLMLAEHRAEGTPDLPRGKVDAHAALRAAVLRLKAGARGQDARIVQPPLGRKPWYVTANPQALERVFYHLLDNAVKFSPAGAEVTVRFDRVGENCYLAVEDRGIGIQPSQLRRIFSHFYQVDRRLSRAYSGMGIGLTLAKVLLEATGGQLLVESRPTEGSVFTIVYPRWPGA